MTIPRSAHHRQQLQQQQQQPQSTTTTARRPRPNMPLPSWGRWRLFPCVVLLLIIGPALGWLRPSLLPSPARVMVNPAMVASHRSGRGRRTRLYWFFGGQQQREDNNNKKNSELDRNNNNKWDPSDGNNNGQTTTSTGTNWGGVAGIMDSMEKFKQAQRVGQITGVMVQELSVLLIDGYGADGRVRVTVDGQQRPVRVAIDETFFAASDVTDVASAVTAAMKEAHAKSVDKMNEKLKALYQELGIPN